jgi:hypothetical protein
MTTQHPDSACLAAAQVLSLFLRDRRALTKGSDVHERKSFQKNKNTNVSSAENTERRR